MEGSREPPPLIADSRPRIAVSYEVFRDFSIGARALWVGIFTLVIILKVQFVLDRPTLEQLLGVSATMAGFSLAVAALVVDYNRDRRLVAAFLLVGYTFLLATGLWIIGLFLPLPVSIERLVVSIIIISAAGDVTIDAIARRRSNEKIFYLWTFASVSVFPIGIAPLGALTMGVTLTVGAFAYLLAFVALLSYSVITTKQIPPPVEENLLLENKARQSILQVLNLERPKALTTDQIREKLAKGGLRLRSHEVNKTVDFLRRQGKVCTIDAEGDGPYTIMPDDALVLQMNSQILSGLQAWRRKIVTRDELVKFVTSSVKFDLAVLELRTNVDAIIQQNYQESPQTKDLLTKTGSEVLAEMVTTIAKWKLAEKLQDQSYFDDLCLVVQNPVMKEKLVNQVKSELAQKVGDKAELTRSEVEELFAALLGKGREQIWSNEGTWVPDGFTTEQECALEAVEPGLLLELGFRKTDGLTRTRSPTRRAWDKRNWPDYVLDSGQLRYEVDQMKRLLVTSENYVRNDSLANKLQEMVGKIKSKINGAPHLSEPTSKNEEERVKDPAESGPSP